MDQNPTQAVPEDGLNVPKQSTNDDAPVTTDSLAEAKKLTDALGDSIVPSRIQARETASTPEVTPIEAQTPAVETPELANEIPVPTIEVAPAEAPLVEEEPEEYIPPAPTVSPIDPAAFADENGYVDVKKLTDAINGAITSVQQTASATAQRELIAQKNEERQWNQALKAYPTLESNKTLRDFVQQARIGKATEAYRAAGNDPARLATVKIPTPSQIASEIFKELGNAKKEGTQAATETTEVVETNRPLTSGPTVPTTSKREELFGQIRNPNRQVSDKAQKELLKELLFNTN